MLSSALFCLVGPAGYQAVTEPSLQPIAPPKYEEIRVNKMSEIADFVTGTDPDTFNEGQYKTMIEGIRKNGFLLEPHYQGNPFCSIRGTDINSKSI